MIYIMSKYTIQSTKSCFKIELNCAKFIKYHGTRSCNYIFQSHKTDLLSSLSKSTEVLEAATNT